MLRRGIVVAVLLGVSACKAKPAEQLSDGGRSSPSPSAALVGSARTTGNCRTRQAILDNEARGYPWTLHPPMKEVAPGEGAGWFCLGDARTAYDEMVRSAELGGAERVCSAVDGGDVEVCRMSNDADLTFQASFLTKIRVHGGRRARDGRYYRSDVYEVPPYTHFSASEDNIKRWLPGPAKRSTILDPDFGQLILLEYDGLTLELERADGGAVLTGIVVQRKGT